MNKNRFHVTLLTTSLLDTSDISMLPIQDDGRLSSCYRSKSQKLSDKRKLHLKPNAWNATRKYGLFYEVCIPHKGGISLCQPETGYWIEHH